MKQFIPPERLPFLNFGERSQLQYAYPFDTDTLDSGVRGGNIMMVDFIIWWGSLNAKMLFLVSRDQRINEGVKCAVDLYGGSLDVLHWDIDMDPRDTLLRDLSPHYDLICGERIFADRCEDVDEPVPMLVQHRCFVAQSVFLIGHCRLRNTEHTVFRETEHGSYMLPQRMITGSTLGRFGTGLFTQLTPA